MKTSYIGMRPHCCTIELNPQFNHESQVHDNSTHGKVGTQQVKN